MTVRSGETCRGTCNVIMIWSCALITISLAFCAWSLPVEIDPTFAAVFDGSIQSLAVQSDGKILVGGGFKTANGVARTHLARLNADSSLDTTFAVSGDVLTGNEGSLRVAPSGVYIHQYPQGVRKYDIEGTFLRSYPTRLTNDPFPSRYAGPFAFAVDSHERVVLGQIHEYLVGDRLARYDENGSRDGMFAVGVGAAHFDGVKAIALQNDDGAEKILIGGVFNVLFTTKSTNFASNLARLNGDGSFDTTFRGTNIAGADVTHIQLAPDGKIYIVVHWRAIARLLPDGTYDSTFHWRSIGPDLLSVAPQADGKVLLGGSIDRNGPTAFLVRLNDDGSLDTDFCVSVNGTQVSDIKIQPDGGILAAGDFTEVNGIRRTSLFRLIPGGVPPTELCDPLNLVPPPQLTITRVRPGRVVVCWPAYYTGYMLQGARVLHPRHPERDKWVTVTNSPATIGETSCVTNRFLRFYKHYRLVKH